MLKISSLIFLVLIRLPAMFSQGGGNVQGSQGQGSMMVDQNDILNQMFILCRQCDYFEMSMMEYEEHEIYPDDAVVYDNNLTILKQMHLQMIQSACNTVRVSERAMYIESSNNQQNSG